MTDLIKECMEKLVKKSPSRYRKVEVRTWGDKKFRALSQLPPCGQGLWLYLITGPHTGPIPGLFRAGRAAMSEELDWDVEAFDKAFAEVFAQGMVKADFKARVIWVPNAIKHNKPESPNVVRSWAAEFDLIPECSLKLEAFEALEASIHALGEAYAKAFDETLGKASSKPFAKTMPNQEQEQEQEQEHVDAGASPVGRQKSKIPACPFDAVIAAYHAQLPEQPMVKLATKKRMKALSAFWTFVLTSKKSDGTPRATNSIEALTWIESYFKRAGENDFLMGRIPRSAEHKDWRPGLDFLLTEAGMVQVIEKTRGAA